MSRDRRRQLQLLLIIRRAERGPPSTPSADRPNRVVRIVAAAPAVGQDVATPGGSTASVTAPEWAVAHDPKGTPAALNCHPTEWRRTPSGTAACATRGKTVRQPLSGADPHPRGAASSPILRRQR
jgi:hypothetical protein